MTLLAVDIGNTNICFSLYDGKNWSQIVRTKTHSDDWYNHFKGELLNYKFDEAVVSSVVPDCTQGICDCITSITLKKPFIISHDILTGLNNESIPEELGSDILCNAIAAHKLYPNDFVTIADFGTAFTTVTVSPEGNILGVTICPGLLTSLKALYENTSQIPQIRLDLPDTILGLDTIASVRAGVIYGFVGQLQSIVSQIEKELNHKVKLLATGGFSVYIAPYVEKIDCVDVNLTLTGAKIAFDLNN